MDYNLNTAEGIRGLREEILAARRRKKQHQKLSIAKEKAWRSHCKRQYKQSCKKQQKRSV